MYIGTHWWSPADCLSLQEGRTPLHYASELGSAELINMLLKRDCSREFVNAQDDSGDTALHLACRQGNEAVIKLLKAKNASKKIINKVCPHGGS